MKPAALQMLDFFLERWRGGVPEGYIAQKKLERLIAFRMIVGNSPAIDPDAPDFHVSMNFTNRELDYPTTDAARWLPVLYRPVESTMSGPYS